MTFDEIEQLTRDLIEHLDYCGWGDRWEREVSEELRTRSHRFEREHPRPEESQLTYDTPDGLCCLRAHATAVPPWTCDCICHKVKQKDD